MEFKNINRIGIVLTVVIAIIAGVSACQKEEINDIEKTEMGIQQLLQLLEENPHVEIYITVSNGAYSIIDNPVNNARPRLKNDYEASDGWKSAGKMTSEQLEDFFQSLRDDYGDNAFEMGIKYTPGEPKPYYVFYRFL